MQAVLDRACKDMRFCVRMIDDPEGALAPFDLTPEERAALKSCRRDHLMEVGLDERMTAWIPWQWSANRSRST